MTMNNNPFDHYSERATLAIAISLILFFFSVIISVNAIYELKDHTCEPYIIWLW